MLTNTADGVKLATSAVISSGKQYWGRATSVSAEDGIIALDDCRERPCLLDGWDESQPKQFEAWLVSGRFEPGGGARGEPESGLTATKSRLS
jgi:hypothetical protein